MNSANTVDSCPEKHQTQKGSDDDPAQHEAGANTTLVDQEAASSPPDLGPWSTGLFDCFQDFNICCLTLWCPCVAVGRVSEIIHQGVISRRLSGTLWILLICACRSSCCYLAWVRSKMRKRYSLEGEPCNDYCLHLCCSECAVCQEYRELVNRGYDMSIGWDGNVQRHQRMLASLAHQTTQHPSVQWGMLR